MRIGWRSKRSGTVGAVADEHDPEASLAAAAALEDEGRLLDAIDLLVAADRSLGSVEVARRLVHLRHAAFTELQRASAPTPWPATTAFEHPLHQGIPAVPIAELTPSVLRSGILQHGCVMVPGLVPPSRCTELVASIDRAFEEFSRHDADPGSTTDGWFEPFRPDPPLPTGPQLEVQRARAGRAGSIWTVDSPRLLQEVCSLTEEVGLGALIHAYIGQRAVMSATKSNLRRVPVDALLADWHQDGAFLGKGIRTVNVWITLTDCGTDAPGMDVVPTRLDDVVETGTGGAIFGWAVGPSTVLEVAGDTPVVRTHLRAGDVLLFDELFLHRTACDPGMTKPRYALENWYFAASDYPQAQVPIVF